MACLDEGVTSKRGEERGRRESLDVSLTVPLWHDWRSQFLHLSLCQLKPFKRPIRCDPTETCMIDSI
jgi:hypothetical protein